MGGVGVTRGGAGNPFELVLSRLADARPVAGLRRRGGRPAVRSMRTRTPACPCASATRAGPDPLLRRLHARGDRRGPGTDDGRPDAAASRENGPTSHGSPATWVQARSLLVPSSATKRSRNFSDRASLEPLGLSDLDLPRRLRGPRRPDPPLGQAHARRRRQTGPRQRRQTGQGDSAGQPDGARAGSWAGCRRPGPCIGWSSCSNDARNESM